MSKESTLIKISKESRPKIAFIFAGSARSFVCPKVHWSLRLNLIDALGGDPYVFVRIAADDNKNVQTGKGTIWVPPYKKNEINETLKVLSPKVVEYFSFTTQIEEMKRNFPSMQHTVFRTNDQRRYSMFYHRCMAYRLMKKFEADHSIAFDWVILVRLDAGWLEPVLPISTYMSDRVWITETGFDLFNDQFMMIPRQFSDYIYNLDTKVNKKVYCLGGPDVEEWKCKKEELVKRGVQEPLLQNTLDACCEDRFDGNRHGASERIHFRHLREGNIPVSTARFPVFLTRRREDTTCFGECFRLYAYHYKEYLFRYNGSLYPLLMQPVYPDTRGRAISSRDKTVCVMIDNNLYFKWKPISAFELHTSNKSNQIDYNRNLYQQSGILHPSIMINNKDIEVWRIRPSWNIDGCLTFSYTHKNITWEKCNDQIDPHDLRYDPRQLFFLYVIPHFPSEYDFNFRPHTQILYPNNFIIRQNGESYSPTLGNYTRIMMTNANKADWEPRGEIQCLTVIKNLNTQVTRNMWYLAKVVPEKCNIDWQHHSQLFHTVQGWTGGTLPYSTVGLIRFAAFPSLCIARNDNGPRNGVQQIFSRPKDNDLYLFDCNYGGNMHRVLFEFELINS